MKQALSFFFFLLFFQSSQAQPGYLFVKKGANKKQTYMEGSRITFQLQNGAVMSGIITLLRNDTIFLNGVAIPRPLVAAILLPRKRNKFPADAKTLLYIGAGVGLTTVGLTLNDRLSWEKALTAGLVIGYAPLLIKYLGRGLLLSLTRKHYRIGRKYRLQVLDFHLPHQRAF